MKTISIQRLRNLTTGRLHTKMEDVYTDIEAFTGMGGVMTPQLPSANAALQPYLRERYKNQPVWDGEYKPDMNGDVPLYPIPEKQMAAFWALYQKMSEQFWGQIGSNRKAAK